MPPGQGQRLLCPQVTGPPGNCGGTGPSASGFLGSSSLHFTGTGTGGGMAVWGFVRDHSLDDPQQSPLN
jgi:hypothetical protein